MLTELIHEAAVHAPDGSLPVPVFRFLWDNAHRWPDLRVKIQEGLIRRSEAPADLVEEFSKIHKPVQLRAAYLCRDDIAIEELEEAVRSEPRIGVIRQMAKIDTITEDVLVALCNRDDLQVAVTVFNHPRARTRARAAAAPTLARAHMKVRTSTLAAFWESAVLEPSVLDAALPHMSRLLLAEIMTTAGTIQYRYAEPRPFRTARPGTVVDDDDAEPDLVVWDPASVSVPLSIPAQQALVRILSEVARAQGAYHGGKWRQSPLQVLDRMDFLIDRITDPDVAKRIVHLCKQISESQSMVLKAEMQAVIGHLTAKFGTVEVVSSAALVSVADAAISKRDAALASRAIRDSRLPAYMVVQLLGIAHVTRDVVDAHRDKPLVMAALLSMDPRNALAHKVIAGLDGAGKQILIGVLGDAYEALSEVKNVHGHPIKRWNPAVVVNHLLATGVIDPEHLGPLQLRSVYVNKNRGFGAFAAAAMTRIISELGDDPERIELLDKIMSGFEGTFDELTSTIVALDD